MNKKLLLVLLLPMALMGMREPVDPSTIHDPCEDSMWWQATSLAGKRVKNNLKTVAGCAAAIGQAAYHAFGATVAHQAILAPTSATYSTLGVLSQQLGQTVVVAHATTGAAAGAATTAALGAAATVVGIGGALVLVEQTGEWGFEVYAAHQKKQSFLAEKNEAIEKFKLFQERRKERREFIGTLAKIAHKA